MKIFPFLSLPIAASLLIGLQAEGWSTLVKAARRMSGFSPDNRHYIYLESSRNPVSDVPTAQIQIINIPTNSCVRNGCLATDYDRSAYDLTNQAAEDDLLNRTVTVRHNLGLTQLKVGIQLPIISRKNNTDGSETVSFRLNTETDPLQIRLEQTHIPSVVSAGSSDVDRTSMRLVINYNYRQLTLGNLNNYRETVRRYSIREARLSPNREYIVVLIDTLQQSEEGLLQETFVQSFSLKSFGG